MSKYDIEVLKDKPVGYWKLDETSGTTAVDSSGKGQDGIYADTYDLNGKPIVSGSESSVYLNNGKVSIANFSLSNISGLSIEGWYNLESYDSRRQISGSLENTVRLIDVQSNGNFYWHFGDGSSWFYVTQQNWNLPLGLHHIAHRYDYDAKIAEIYIDGELVGSIDSDLITSDSASFSGTFYIGNYTGSSNLYFKGHNSHFAIYDYTLTPDQIQSHYEAGVEFTDYSEIILHDGPISYFMMDETPSEMSVYRDEPDVHSMEDGTLVRTFVNVNEGLELSLPGTADFSRGTTAHNIDDGSEVAISVPRYVNGLNMLSEESSSFEGGTTGIWGINGSGASFTNITTDFKFGSRASEITVTDSATGTSNYHDKTVRGYFFTDYQGQVTWTAWLKGTAGREIHLRIVPHDTAGTVWNSAVYTKVIASGSWERAEVTLPAYSGTSRRSRILLQWGLRADEVINGDFVRGDGMQLEQGDVAHDWRIGGDGALITEEGVTNLLTANQSNIETDTSGFSVANGATLTRTTTTSWEGAASLQIDTPGTGSAEGTTINFVESTHGDYIGSTYLKGSGNIHVWIRAIYSDGTYTEGIRELVVANENWRRVVTPVVTTDTAKTLTDVQLHIRTEAGGAAQAVTYYIDGNQVERKNYERSWHIGGGSRGVETLTVSSVDRPDLTGDLTIEFWIYRYDNQYRTNPLQTQYWAEFAITHETNGTLNYYHGDGGDDPEGAGDYHSHPTYGSVPLNTWSYIAFTRNLSTKTIKSYIDGAFDRSTTWGTGYDPGVSTNPLMILHGYAGPQYQGYMAGFRLSSRVLTNSEIMDSYNRGYFVSNKDTLYMMNFSGNLNSSAAGYRDLPVLDLSVMQNVAGSKIKWLETKPANTNIVIETSPDGNVWTPATSGGEVPNVSAIWGSGGDN